MEDIIGTLFVAPWKIFGDFLHGVGVFLICMICFIILLFGGGIYYNAKYQPYCAECNAVIEVQKNKWKYCPICGTELNDSTIYKGFTNKKHN